MKKNLLIAIVAFALSACAETQLASHYAKQVPWPGQPQNQGTYKVGKPYNIGGTWYHPKEDYSLVETGIASWYGPDFHGKKTANGEIYDQNELTAAHRTLPMPSLVRVTNLENGRSVVLRINDRGPFKRGRVIDVSKRGADLLGFIGRGTAQVKVEVLEKESRQIAEAAKAGMNTSRITMADLDRYPAPQPKPAVQMASAAPADDLPESLRVPTITVEELNAPARPLRKPQPAEIAGHMTDGKFMPDPVVTSQPVVATGIFVQAGSFAVFDNAQRLRDQLDRIAPAKIEQVAVNGRTLYRVKLGPIASVEEADSVLSRVVREGTDGARVVRN